MQNDLKFINSCHIFHLIGSIQHEIGLTDVITSFWLDKLCIERLHDLPKVIQSVRSLEPDPGSFPWYHSVFYFLTSTYRNISTENCTVEAISILFLSWLRKGRFHTTSVVTITYQTSFVKLEYGLKRRLHRWFWKSPRALLGRPCDMAADKVSEIRETCFQLLDLL